MPNSFLSNVVKNYSIRNYVHFGIATVFMVLVVFPFANTAHARQAEQPLNVPVYPGFKKENRPVDVESLRDSYIVLEDGAVLSLADWVLGSLDKADVGIGMSDYQNRLFLGQVARAAIGMKQDLVYRSFEDAGPLRLFVPKRPAAPLQLAQGILSNFIPALAPNWSPEISGKPDLTDPADRGRSASIHFDNQFSDSLFQTTEQFSYQQRLETMLDEFRQKADQ